MTTLAAFNEMMGQFIGELAQTFPDEPKIKEVQATPMNRATFDQFMKDLAPWVSQMMAKDPAFFSEANPVAASLNLHVIWKSADCTDNTKAAIWQYYQTLYMLGTTINMFPPETLSMIETAAENCAKNMRLDPSGRPDEASLMAGMNTMLSQMLGGGAGGGANPLAAMLGGGGAGPGPRVAPKTAKRKVTKKNSK
jgi:hypothetical protein